MRPFTSKDCDIRVSPRTWKTLKRNPAIRRGDSPADGQLGVLTLSEEPPRVVDVLSSVYGIDVKEYPRLLERALDDGTVKVIDPIHLFLSKCHCLLNLPQADRQDERHVRMMALIVPEYLSLLIGDVETEALSGRALLNEIKLVKKIASTAICRRAIVKAGAGTEMLIPWERLASSESEILAKYAQSQRLV